MNKRVYTIIIIIVVLMIIGVTFVISYNLKKTDISQAQNIVDEQKNITVIRNR